MLAEGDLYVYGRDEQYGLPGKPYEVKPVLLLHGLGRGWILWDMTFAKISATGAHAPECGKLTENFLEWAGGLRGSFGR